MTSSQAPSAPQTTNKTATVVNAIIKAGDNAAIDAVEAVVIADVPWLGWPGIKQVWEGLFYWLAGYFIRAEENGATFVIIDLQTGAEDSDIKKAMAALIAAKKSGDKNAIAAAIKQYQAAQSALVADDGSAPAQ